MYPRFLPPPSSSVSSIPKPNLTLEASASIFPGRTNLCCKVLLINKSENDFNSWPYLDLIEEPE